MRRLLPALGGAAFAALLSMSAMAHVGAIPMLLKAPTAAPSGTGTLTLTNGPPNIPEGTSGGCTIRTCTWIEAGISGEAVSDVYLDMVPMSENYTATCPGAFTIADTTHFAITCSSDGTRSVGHITTASALAAGDYATSVSADGVTQNITVHAVSGYSISSYGGCNASGLSGASSAAGSYTNGSTGPGGIVLIPASCSVTLSGDMNPASNNQIIIGAGPQGSASGGSTFNGNGNNSYGACVGNCESGSGSPTGDALMNIEFTGATLNCTPGNDVCKEATQTNENWVIRNMYYHDNDQGIADKGCGAQIYNSRFINNAYNGFHGNPETSCPSNEPQYIVGSEWAGNGFCACDNNDDGGQKWINGSATWTLDIWNSYAHNNYEIPLWMDSNQGSQALNFYDDTVIGNADNVFLEAGTMPIAIYQSFFEHNSDGTTPKEICNAANQGACGIYGGQITDSGSSNISIHDNNFVQAANGSSIDYAILVGDYHDGGEGTSNVDFNNNTVTFLQAEPGGSCSCVAHGGDVDFDGGGIGNPSGDNAYLNHYHLAYSGANTSSDQHWSWWQTAPQSYPAWQGSGAGCDGSGNCSAANPDNNGSGSGTIDTSTADVAYATGCTHVACSGSGIGPDGVPIQ